jgi:hypothetical protein
MMLRALLLSALLPAVLSAGVLTLPDGTEIEGVFSFSTGEGLALKAGDGTLHKATPGVFKSILVDAADAIWPEELRARRTNEFGLLGQYFEGNAFEGKPRVRVDTDLSFQWHGGGPFPDWRNDGFSARWSGHFQVPETEDYEFFTYSDDGVRLFIDDKQIIANWSDHSLTENKGTLRLDASALHELRVEYYENSGDAGLRVEWAGRDGKRQPLSSLILITDAVGLTENKVAEATEIGLRPGIVLRDGTVLDAKVRRANDTAFELDPPFAGLTISTFNIARVVFREIPPDLAARTRPNRQGALLVGGDFVDSEFHSLENGILNLSSLLFGMQKLDTKYETHALMLREPRAERPRWKVANRDGSVFLTEILRFTSTGITISNAILHEMTLPLDTLVEIQAAPADELFPSSLRFGPESVHGDSTKKPRSDDSERRRIDSLKRMAEQEKSRRTREMSDSDRKAREEQNALVEERRKVAETVTKHAAAEREFTRLKAEYQELEKIQGTASAEQKEAEDVLQKITREYGSARSLITQIESRQKREDSIAKNLEKSLKKRGSKTEEEQITARRRELEEVRARQKALLEEHREAVKNSETLRSQREEKDRSLAAKKREIANRKSALDRSIRVLENAERQLRSFAGQLSEQRQRLAATEEKVADRQRAQLR